MTLFIPAFDFLTQLKIETVVFSYLQGLYQQIGSKLEDYPLHKIYNGIIYRQRKPVISPSSP